MRPYSGARLTAVDVAAEQNGAVAPQYSCQGGVKGR